MMQLNAPTTLAAAAIAAAGLFAGQAQGAAVVHESFAGANGAISDITGYAGGTGMDGTWTGTWGTGFMGVQDATMSAGDLGSSGRELMIKSHSVGFEAWNTTSALSGAGLLANGSTLWFSYLVERDNAGFAAGGHEGFALSSSQFDSSANGPKVTDGGAAVGVYVNKNSPYKAAAWVGGGEGPTATSASGHAALGNGVTQLIVGKIEWGAAAADETITLYSPSLTGLALGTGHSLTVGDVDQSTFDTITISARESGANVYFDEIRFGATYDDVIAVPEPSSLALLGLGGLLIARRRRG